LLCTELMKLAVHNATDFYLDQTLRQKLLTNQRNIRR
jgi:hypothetical protein